MLHGLAMLLKLAVGPQRLLGGLFGLARRLLERLNASLDLFDLLGAVVKRGQALADLVEPRCDTGRLFGHLVERLAERHQLRTARGQRGQHRADGAALLPRRRNEHLELFGLLLNQLALAAGQALEGVQHVRVLQRGSGLKDSPVRISASTAMLCSPDRRMHMPAWRCARLPAADSGKECAADPRATL